MSRGMDLVVMLREHMGDWGHGSGVTLRVAVADTQARKEATTPPCQDFPHLLFSTTVSLTLLSLREK